MSMSRDAVSKRAAAVPQFLTVDEVADMVRVRPRTVYQWVAERRIPHYKPGRTLLFDPAEIEQWIKDSRREATPPLTAEAREAVSSPACR
jgi:excisionase family DNA binding protein